MNFDFFLNIYNKEDCILNELVIYKIKYMTTGILILMGFSILGILYIFRGIFRSKKSKTRFYHKSRFFGENFFEQSD